MKPGVSPALISRARSVCGFTLTEVLLALAISVIVLGFLFSALGVLRRAEDGIFARMKNQGEPRQAIRELARAWESATDPFPDVPPVRSAHSAGAANDAPLLTWFGPAPHAVDSGEWGQHELVWTNGVLWTITKPWSGAEGRWAPSTNRVASLEAPPTLTFYDGQAWLTDWPPPDARAGAARLPRGIRIEGKSRATGGDAWGVEAAIPCATVVTSRLVRAAQAAPPFPAADSPAR